MYPLGFSKKQIDRFQGIKILDYQATVNYLLKSHVNVEVAVIPDDPYVLGKIAHVD